MEGLRYANCGLLILGRRGGEIAPVLLVPGEVGHRLDEVVAVALPEVIGDDPGLREHARVVGAEARRSAREGDPVRLLALADVGKGTAEGARRVDAPVGR